MKRSWRILVLGIAAITVVSTVLLGISYARNPRSSQVEERTAAMYTVGVWDGRLAVFTGDDKRPSTLFEVAVASLPPDEQKRLRAGIAVQSAGELERLLEDYTS